MKKIQKTKKTDPISLLPSYTKKQKKIFTYLYQFRFLHTYQFQKLFHHKDAHRVKEWLKDLVKKGYLTSDYKDDVFPHKPAVYSLTKLARKLLKKEEEYDIRVLNLLYRKKELTEQFINHHLAIADLYLFFEEKQEKDATLSFFTKYELVSYEYLQPLDLSAYIEIETKKETDRYFLHLFDSQTPSFVYRNTVTNYLKYYNDYIWQEATENEPFPMVLFVCHDENAKKHIKHYAKAEFEKEYEEKFILYVTTIKTILGQNKDVWEKVE